MYHTRTPRAYGGDRDGKGWYSFLPSFPDASFGISIRIPVGGGGLRTFTVDCGSFFRTEASDSDVGGNGLVVVFDGGKAAVGVIMYERVPIVEELDGSMVRDRRFLR